MNKIVDRKSRDALVVAINRYLGDETTAFQFDDEIFSINSDDSTVSHIVCNLWCFYDDCKDHKVRLSRDEWDYFQRLVLVLQSNGHIEVITRRRWDFTQLIAISALLLFLYAASWLGLGMQLFALAIPFGVVSIAISCWRSRSAARKPDPTTMFLSPFSSFSELIHLRRGVPRFRKRKCPAGMKRFNIRSPLEETAVKLQYYAGRLLFAPLVLMFQALPTTETNTRVTAKLETLSR